MLVSSLESGSWVQDLSVPLISSVNPGRLNSDPWLFRQENVAGENSLPRRTGDTTWKALISAGPGPQQVPSKCLAARMRLLCL